MSSHSRTPAKTNGIPYHYHIVPSRYEIAAGRLCCYFLLARKASRSPASHRIAPGQPERIAEGLCGKPWHQIRRALERLQVTEFFD
jgi:hypothetical protein